MDPEKRKKGSRTVLTKTSEGLDNALAILYLGDVKGFKKAFFDAFDEDMETIADALSIAIRYEGGKASNESMKSIMMAKYMRDKVAGVIVPDQKVERLQKAADQFQEKQDRIKAVRAEAVKIAVEEIHQCIEIPGVHGVHIMAVAWEEIIPEIVKTAGLDKERPKYKP